MDIHGIRSGRAFSTVTNFGTVSGNEDGIFSIGDNTSIVNYGTAVGQKAGIGSQGDNSMIINYGTIRTDGDPDAIGLVGVNSELILMPGSVIERLVRFDGINEKLTIAARRNVYLEYGGAFAALDAATPHLQDTTNGLVVAVDPTGFAIAGLWLQMVTGTIQEAIHGASRPDKPAGAFSGGAAFGYGTAGSGLSGNGAHGWISGFGGYQGQSGSGAVNGADQTCGRGIAGGHVIRGERLYGVFAGGSHSRFKTGNNVQSVNVSSACAPRDTMTIHPRIVCQTVDAQLLLHKRHDSAPPAAQILYRR